ncbi:MAG: hypothetical protein V3U76_15050 [Granulosicoccus sp.]
MTTHKSVALSIALCMALVLDACASKPAEVDNTPLVRAAIVTSDVRNNGFKGLFASDGIQVVNTVVDMRRVNETCAAPPEAEAEEEDKLNTSSIGGLLQSVGEQLIKQEVKKKQDEKLREIELAPLFSYIEELKSIEIGDVHESQLSVPVNFKLDNRS